MNVADYFGPPKPKPGTARTWLCATCGKPYKGKWRLERHGQREGHVAIKRVIPRDARPTLPVRPWGWVPVAVGHWVKIDTDGRPWVAWIP